MKLRSAFERMETIAEGRGIREYARLVERFGGRSWKKRKGIAAVEVDGESRRWRLTASSGVPKFTGTNVTVSER